MTKIGKGYALIASPKLKDDPFRRSVVYLTQCDSRSAVGFIMNRPTKLLLGQFFPQVKQAVRLYSGGPVENGMLYFIHDIPHILPESIPIRGGVFWGGQFETLLELLAQGDVSPANVRFFLGYAGWGEGQLDEEINGKYWFAEPFRGNPVTADRSDMWTEMLCGDVATADIIRDNAPDDIELN